MAKISNEIDKYLAWFMALFLILAVVAWFQFSWDKQGTSNYWYCWDKGEPRPHHLDRNADDDHHCSQHELEQSGYDKRG